MGSRGKFDGTPPEMPWDRFPMGSAMGYLNPRTMEHPMGHPIHGLSGDLMGDSHGIVFYRMGKTTNMPHSP